VWYDGLDWDVVWGCCRIVLFKKPRRRIALEEYIRQRGARHEAEHDREIFPLLLIDIAWRFGIVIYIQGTWSAFTRACSSEGIPILYDIQSFSNRGSMVMRFSMYSCAVFQSLLVIGYDGMLVKDPSDGPDCTLKHRFFPP
jgi:hypothetical protein